MQLLRWSELTVIFLFSPLLVLFLVSDYDTWLMPLLGLMAGYCLFLLMRDVNFKRFRLWHTEEFWFHIGKSLKLFVPVALVLAIAVYVFAPDILFILPREEWRFWLLTLAIYPIVSVIPQELIFRTFFFHRYKQIIPSKNIRWLLSTASFSLAHVVYGNWIAVGLASAGGALFGYRYIHTRSTLVVVVEHTLWGSYLFTLGIGVFLLTQNI
ncbi:MAG: membrane protease YdiL (CAAX protease family) [Paraglaciecola sp.]|jgi:membrane protease YdiL (CAAX protease family)